MKKIYVLSLGCPRNLLDSEVLLGLLEKKGFDISEVPEGADMAIVNTCGFIEDSKRESVDIILQLADMKKDGKIKSLVVTGCLSQRYPSELMDEIKEIDGVFGTSDFIRIPGMIDTLLSGKKIREVNRKPDFLYDHLYERSILTPPHYVYVKIQEGCSNRCSYCVIPGLKGPCRSRSIASVLEEVKILKDKHDMKEIVLIGQDTTSFGIDRTGRPELAELLKSVSALVPDAWTRLLYTHPARFTDDLVSVIAETDNICKYIDLPIQHVNDRILQKMNRRVAKREIEALLGRLRGRIKDITLRTSVIVGFPGETEDEFKELLDFLANVKFDRLGAFLYSREEGTLAHNFEGQVPEDVKKERFDKVMKLQREISADKNLAFLGKSLKTLIDEEDPSDPEQFVGRSQMDAPEVDGVIYLKGENLRAGHFTDVRVTGTMEYDLIGEAI
ncbi:MAG: 30S ribosomal protein S12 methylthiotransferase RimO [Candidatus Omnitrophota bacterium]|nr:30S ribosomal protein S12 methylthiotransferase RimO [Candidatus Omnitrophota bacterium]